MATYNEKQKKSVSEYINALVPEKNTFLKEAAQAVALKNMVPENNDEEVADAIINYINDFFSDKGNVIYAETLNVIPKTILYVARNDIIALLKKNRDGKEEPLTIKLSVTGPIVLHENEQIEVMVALNGGDSLNGYTVKTVLCPTAMRIEKISENKHKIIFNTIGTHVITAEAVGVMDSKKKTATVNFVTKEPVNQPPSPIILTLSDPGPLTLEDEDLNVQVVISGGIDPEGKPVTISLTCPTAKDIVKSNDNKYYLVFAKVGTHVITVTATDVKGLSVSDTKRITINAAKNDPPNPISIGVSAATLTLGTGADATKTVTLTINGGDDPEGKPVTKTVECSTASNIRKVNDNKWEVSFNSVRMHVIVVTSSDNIGQKTVATTTIDVKGSSSSSQQQSAQFTNAKFDSGWSETVPGCYVSGVNLSLTIGSGHSSSNDYLVILGKKDDGTIVILRDKFNASNRFKTVQAGAEINNSMYAKGNLAADTHKWTKDPYTLDNNIRQVRFVCETPGHEGCAKNAVVTFSLDYTFDPSLT